MILLKPTSLERYTQKRSIHILSTTANRHATFHRMIHVHSIIERDANFHQIIVLSVRYASIYVYLRKFEFSVDRLPRIPTREFCVFTVERSLSVSMHVSSIHYIHAPNEQHPFRGEFVFFNEAEHGDTVTSISTN